MAAARCCAFAALFCVLSLAVDGLQPPSGYEDELLCPPGRCRQPHQLKDKGNKKQSLQECSAGFEKDEESIPPKGLGEKISASTWEALTQAGWHNATCLEVSHGRCAYVHGSAEWSVCRVASNFLLKILSELNAGKEEAVPKVRGLLAPYLDGPGTKIPDDIKHKEAAEKELMTLWKEVDNRTAETYLALGLDASTLAAELLKVLTQDGFGHLQPAKDHKGKVLKPGITVQKTLFNILGVHNWRSVYAVTGGGWNVYTWHLAIGLTIAFLAILMVGFAMWRARILKTHASD